MRRKFGIVLGALLGVGAFLALAGWAYVDSLDLESLPQANSEATASDLGFVAEGPGPRRGRILAVVTSTGSFGAGGKRTGFELTELARAYWVFRANGYEVDFASPLGGEPPMVVDEDLVDTDHAFLNDRKAMASLKKS